jgi:hypothetical protein
VETDNKPALDSFSLVIIPTVIGAAVITARRRRIRPVTMPGGMPAIISVRIIRLNGLDSEKFAKKRG